MAVAPHYTRSEVHSFFDLNETQQAEVKDLYDGCNNEEDSYVVLNDKALPLSMFLRTERSKVWDGVYGTSYFSAYFIKLSKCGTMAVVAERFS